LAARLVVVAWSIVFFLAACADELSPLATHHSIKDPAMVSSDELGKIISNQGELIMRLDDVVGIGEGLCDGAPCIRVFLARANAASIARIQELLAGVPFETDVSGEFLASPQ